MSDWLPFDTAPKDGTMIRVLLSCGRESIAEYWGPMPVELDPEQNFHGWAFDATGFWGEDYGEPTHWKPLEDVEAHDVGDAF